jgi:Helix-turn-helix
MAPYRRAGENAGEPRAPAGEWRISRRWAPSASVRGVAWDDIPRRPEEQRGFDLVGATIKRKRLALGWTQRTLEAYSGIDQTVISRIENGKQYGLRWVRFARLVDALDGLELASPTERPRHQPRPWW